MTLKQLKEIIDNITLHYRPEDVSVLIDLAEMSIGAGANSGIRSANMGIDWETGQFRLYPTEELVRKGKSLKDSKPIICEQYDGRNVYWCPECGYKIAKSDRYCRYCGQGLKASI